MLYKLFLSLTYDLSVFNVFRYITFRIILAALTSMSLWFFFGPKFIAMIRDFRVKQYIREDCPSRHQKKAGTPTMGGLMLLASAYLSCILWVDLDNKMVWLILLVSLLFAAIGFRDDYLKILKKENKGLSGWHKFGAQCLIGLVVALILYCTPGFDQRLTIPFFKKVIPDLGLLYIPFATFVLVGSSNAVNLTDGLDGLAIGPFIMSAATYMVLSYCAGNSLWAVHLQILAVPEASEIAVVMAALIGSSLGFLWYNTYPAEIFLGDVGSLSLGAALGMAALIAKQEIVLIIVGGIFVVEAMSVIMQVGFFKITKGKRLFLMAPLHHSFELKGWAEPKIIVRFWIIAIILGLAGLSTLKLR